MSKEAMKLALEALKESHPKPYSESVITHVEAIKALEEALASEQEQGEPVAWWIPKAEQFCLQNPSGERPFAKAWEPLYTTPQQRKPLTADDMKEPKNGSEWRVEWWNESCRMMLPSNKRLDCFQSYKNGTLQFTIKEAAHGIKE